MTLTGTDQTMQYSKQNLQADAAACATSGVDRSLEELIDMYLLTFQSPYKISNQ